jgi:hypothetical protein
VTIIGTWARTLWPHPKARCRPHKYSAQAYERFHVPYVKVSRSAPNGIRLRSWSLHFYEPRKDRRLSMDNQGAFDTALLHLLIQGHRNVSSSGRSQLHGSRGGKSAIGALIPERLYKNSMEGKTIQQLLAAYNPEYLPLRRHLSGVGLPLLNALQDLHDRTGECLPSLFREILLAGGQRIARMFGLSMRMIQLWSAYRKLAGPRLPQRTTSAVLQGSDTAPSYSGDVGVSPVI